MGTRMRIRTRVIACGVVAAAATAAALTVPPALAAQRHHGGEGGDGGRGTVLAASLNGANEVPVQGGPAVGDQDGAALEFVKVAGDKVSVAVKWRGTGRPTMLHIHEGAKGTNGGVKIDFGSLLKDTNLKDIRHHSSLTGTVTVKDSALLGRLKADPGAFYANLHTAEFPGGAVRGQLHRVTTPFGFGDALDSFQASVVRGRQIYECKKDPATGAFAFAQRDVRAVLGGRIAHSFTAPDSGTPQWVAPDRSAVTGAVIGKMPNGDGNIPELDLKATQSGKRHGLLAGTAEILRLNTVGGVAPSGSCAAGDLAAVPYRADYVFVQR
ncbi:CHRD domain-containing protein [Streptomyces longispororuber]|uniref:CHRD domain-containing protein n=1 Tax=Streptomyces longispororuber TaxID=68230 RepID=UPI00210BF4B5|nr:CHRD domain-containing protein [Streptomyces longispororuber]MCQ4209912.1 CHRD domain-containing protein [Streptomyces longispororuber]